MKTLNWGLIGAGDIVQRRVAPAIRDLANSDLAAISRSQSDLAESFAKQFSTRKWYADCRELLKDDEVEAVYIATPVYLHASQTIAAAEAGKHVLCEKPMALNVKESDEMLAACRANSVKLGVAYYRRFYPVVNRIKQIIASGEIGKVAVAQINAFEYVDLAPDDARHWFLEKEKSGGGPMMDFGCHRLEVLTNLFGAVRRVESIVANVFFQREVEDTATAILQFESGTCANLMVTHASIEPRDTLDIFGTLGSIHVPVLNKPELRIKTRNGERAEFHPTAVNTHQPLIEDFAEAVINDCQPAITGETGRLIAVLEAEIYAKG